MNTEKPATSAKLTPSWGLLPKSIALVREHYVTIMYLMLIPSLILALGSQLIGTVNEEGAFHSSSTTGIGIALFIIGAVWSLVNLGPATLFELQASKNKPLTLSEYYAKGLPFSFKLYGYYILYGLLVVGGLILFIVPGIIMFRRYALASYYIVDNGSSVRDAMKQSAKESKTYSGRIWGIFGVQAVFSLGAAALGGIPVIGVVLSQLIVYLVLMLPVLRYLEIKQASRTAPLKSAA